MRTSAERRPASFSSSQTMVGRSRWLVGSSSSRISGCGRQGADQRGAPPLAAREPRRVLLAGEAEAPGAACGDMGIVERRQAGLDIGHDGREVGKVRLLRQIAQARAGLEKALAGVDLDLAGGDLEQGRFARAIASDKAQPRAGRDRQIDAFEQRLAAEREGHALQGQQRGRSHESFRVKGIRRDGFSHGRGRLVEAGLWPLPRAPGPRAQGLALRPKPVATVAAVAPARRRTANSHRATRTARFTKPAFSIRVRANPSASRRGICQARAALLNKEPHGQGRIA